MRVQIRGFPMSNGCNIKIRITSAKQTETRSRWRLKRLRSEPRICLIENQNKEKEPFLKIASSGAFSCNALSLQEF